MQDLVRQGLVASENFDADDPLGFVTSQTDVASLPEAAYRYCRWEPGAGRHPLRHGTTFSPARECPRSQPSRLFQSRPWLIFMISSPRSTLSPATN